MVQPALPCSLDELVPHRPPMKLLDALEVYTEEHGEVVGRVGEDHPFMVPGSGLHPAATIEILAQGAAAHEGFRRRSVGAAVGGGFLASVRSFEFLGTARSGDVLRVVAHRGLAIDRLQLVAGAVSCGSKVVAEGELTFFLSDDLVPEEMPPPREPPLPGETSSGEGACTELIMAALERSCEAFEPDGMRAVYRFDPSFPAFSGHFPSYPILPAVVSLMAAAHTVTALEGGSFALGGVRSAKFARPILPGTEVEVSCTPDPVGDRRHWKVQLRVGDDLVGKMKLLAK